jgi:flagellin-specific chaperone FliS
MAPWDETPSKNYDALKKEILQMEKEKVVDKSIEEMMNIIRDLFLSLDYEEVFKEKTYE